MQSINIHIVCHVAVHAKLIDRVHLFTFCRKISVHWVAVDSY